jgi:hypothetical protein
MFSCEVRRTGVETPEASGAASHSTRLALLQAAGVT